MVAGHHAHAVVGVHDYGGGGILHDVHLRHREEGAVDNPVNVNGLEAVAAVALNAPAVRLQQDVRADFRILLGHAITLKGIGQKAVHQIPGYIRSCFHSSILLLPYLGRCICKKSAATTPTGLGSCRAHLTYSRSRRAVISVFSIAVRFQKCKGQFALAWPCVCVFHKTIVLQWIHPFFRQKAALL